MSQQDPTIQKTQPLNTKPSGDDGLSLPSLPGPVELKQRCDAVIAFCHHAHKLSVESATRCGVPEELIERLRLDRTLPRSTNSSLINELSYDGRQKLLDETRASLREVAQGHTGSFPDFLGIAQCVAQFFRRFEEQGLGFLDQEFPSRDGSDPLFVARALDTLLSITHATSRNDEQTKSTKSLINALANLTRESMPNLSTNATRRSARTLDNR